MTQKKKSTTKKNNKKKKKQIISSDKILLIVFCGLLVTVIVLLGLVLYKKHEKEANPPANIVIPIYKDFTSYHFSVSALGLSQKDNYIFKITNYRGKKINQNDINYEIKVENSTDSVIKITKNNKEKDLMKDNKNSIIDGKITSNKKVEDSYRITMSSHKKLKDKDFIRIEISNKDVKEEKAE